MNRPEPYFHLNKLVIRVKFPKHRLFKDQFQLPPFGFRVSYSDFVDVSALCGAFPAVYDTNTAPIGILEVQVSIRFWDRRTDHTRQITLIHDDM